MPFTFPTFKEAVESIPASRHLWREFFSISGHDPHGAGFILGDFRQWVQGVDSEEVGGGFGKMHRNKYPPHCGSLSHPSAQDDGAAARRNAYRPPVLDVQTRRVAGIDLNVGRWIEFVEFGMARQGATMPVLENPPRGEDERIFLVRHFYRGRVFDIVKFAFAARKGFSEQKRRAGMALVPHRRL